MANLNRMGYRIADNQADLTPLQAIVLLEGENYLRELETPKKGK